MSELPRINARAAEDAEEALAYVLARVRPDNRGPFLRALGCHAAASLTMAEGAEAAACHLYRLADAVVARG